MMDSVPMPESLEEAASRAASLMDGYGAPWCVAGGWAVDLFLGRRTRPHADLDLAIFRGDEQRLHEHLAGWTLELAVSGVLQPWVPGERILRAVHEIWARSPDGGRLELLLNEHAGTEWIYRRDPAVRCPLAEVVTRSQAGVPVLCPAVVLLYKSRASRETDEHDFEQLLPALPAPQRRWLREALALAHPGHPWEGRL
jgi:hypothetical protein